MSRMILWLVTHLLFAGTTFFAAGASANPGGGDGGTGAGTGAGSGDPAAGGQPGGGTPSSGGTAGSGSGAQGGNQDNIRQLRENYEGLKTKYEPWEKLGVKPDQVAGFQGVYQKVLTEASTLGRDLGYPDDEIAEALAEDPVRTIDFLRNEAQRAQSGDGRREGDQDLNELVSRHVNEVLSPIQQRENQRITQEANSLFERTVHQLAADSFKAEGVEIANIPQDEMYLLTSAVSEILKYDPEALKALKYEGKTAAVQKAFQEARTMLDKYYIARSGRDRARVQPGNRGAAPAAQGNQGGRRPTLDEMIEDPGRISEKYA